MREQIRLEALEREESRRIAEMYPILWASERSESPDSMDSICTVHSTQNSEILSGNNVSLRTPSPTTSFGCKTTADHSVKSKFCSANRDILPKARKTIHKTPHLAFIKTDAPAKAISANCFKSLRVDLLSNKMPDIELSPRAASLSQVL